MKVIFDTLVWEEHSVTHTEWDNLLIGKEVERKIVEKISITVTITIIIKMIKKPMLKYFEVY